MLFHETVWCWFELHHAVHITAQAKDEVPIEHVVLSEIAVRGDLGPREDSRTRKFFHFRSLRVQSRGRLPLEQLNCDLSCESTSSRNGTSVSRAQN